MTLRVVVADDQALVRVGFCGIIAATPGFTVVGEAGDGAEAVEAARRTKPDVILMDVRMPVMDGIKATRRITESTDVRALILTTFDLDEYVFAALNDCGCLMQIGGGLSRAGEKIEVRHLAEVLAAR